MNYSINQNNMITKALVTGASGFVGSALCAELDSQGIQVVRAVRKVRSPLDTEIGEIGPDLQAQAALEGCDTVFHLAAVVHVMSRSNHPGLEDYRAVNVAGTLAIAKQAAEAGVRHFVFVSSIKVLGEEGHFSEDSNASPLDPYGISKLEAEKALLALARESTMQITIVRPPLVYGPGVGANFLKLFQTVQKGIPLPFGLAHNQRSLVYVGNLTHALILCARSDKGGRTYLVDDGYAVSTRELIQKMASALSVPSRLLPVPVWLIKFCAQLAGRSHVAQRVLGSLTVDSSLIRQELGWQPPYTLEQGLRNTAEWLNSPGLK
jgi:nucleoside-diphosphate-sugar epimerase